MDVHLAASALHALIEQSPDEGTTVLAKRWFVVGLALPGVWHFETQSGDRFVNFRVHLTSAHSRIPSTDCDHVVQAFFVDHLSTCLALVTYIKH